MVVDTGVLISAFIFGGIPEVAMKKAFNESEIWVSPQILKEYRDTPFELINEGKITSLQLKSLVSGIASFISKAHVTVPTQNFFIYRDEMDNVILDCCFSANVDFLITGDKDILEIEESKLKIELPKLKIVSPRIFLTIWT